MKRPLKILFVGPSFAGSNSTCFRDAFVELGCDVRTVDDEVVTAPPPDLFGRIVRRARRRASAEQIGNLNRMLLVEASAFRPDFLFYVKGYYVLPDTINALRKYGPAISYMNDDMFSPGISTFTFRDNIRLLDLIFTTKSFSVREYQAAGAPCAIYIPNAYDPKIHYPVKPSVSEYPIYNGDVTFIGMFTPSKADVLASVARLRDFQMNIWGNWERMTRIDNWPASRRWRVLKPSVRGRSVFCAEMGKAIQASKITLGLLCREVRDLHTSRSFEIPACGGFMVAQRTEEHRMYFEEDREAVYFGSHEELIDKIRFYIGHDSCRERIAAAGYERVLRSAATYRDRALTVLSEYGKLTERSHPLIATSSA
jgi:spore maturation protein CgeB